MLAAFAEVGLPDGAIPFVLEELNAGREPSLVAAAARAASGAPQPDVALASALVAALERIHSRDNTVTFESLAPTWPVVAPTTATAEVLAALRALGPVAAHALDDLRAVMARVGHDTSTRRKVAALLRDLESQPPAAHCCGSHAAPDRVGEAAQTAEPRAVDLALELEDQDGAALTMAELLRERVTVVAFFYTRCENPDKCSATITRLARVQTLAGPRVGVAAITYDPGYDTPARLRAYGAARGIRSGPTARLVRCPRQHDALAQSFGLLVGYNGSVVNRHAIELHLVATNGRILATWARVPWDPDEVTGTAQRLAAAVRATAWRPPRLR